MPPFITLLQSTPVPIPILPSPFPTPPPPEATLVAEQIFWDLEQWKPAISATRTIFHLQFMDYFLYFIIFMVLVLLGLRVFGFVMRGAESRSDANALYRVESQLEGDLGRTPSLAETEAYIRERERIRDEPERIRQERDRLGRRAREI